LVPGPAQWLATVSALCDLLILLHHPSTLSLFSQIIEVDARSPRPSLSFIVLVYQAFLSESRSRTVTASIAVLNIFQSFLLAHLIYLPSVYHIQPQHTPTPLRHLIDLIETIISCIPGSESLGHPRPLSSHSEKLFLCSQTCPTLSIFLSLSKVKTTSRPPPKSYFDCVDLNG
jgi:hypothetical protein